MLNSRRDSSPNWISLSLWLIVSFACSILIPQIASAQTESALSEDATESVPMAIPQGLSEEQIDQFIAPLTDRDARALLRSYLVSKATLVTEGSEPSPDAAAGFGGVAELLEQLRNGSSVFSENFAAITAALSTTGAVAAHAMLLLTDLEGAPRMRAGIYNLILMIFLGLVAALLVNRLFGRVEKQFMSFNAETIPQKFKLLVLRGGIKSVELVAFFVTGQIASLLYFDRYDPMRLFLLAWFSTLVIYFLATILGRILLSPAAPNLRLITLDDHAARKLYKGLVWSVALAAFTVFNTAMFILLGVPAPLLTVWNLLMGSIIAAVIVFSVNWNKSTVEPTPLDINLVATDKVEPSEQNVNTTSSLSTDSLRHTFILLKIVGCVILFSLWMRATISQDTPSSIAVIIIAIAIASSQYLGVISTSTVRDAVPAGATSSTKSVQIISFLFWVIAIAAFIQTAGFDLYGFSQTTNGKGLTIILGKVILIALVGMILWSILSATMLFYLNREHAKALAALEKTGGGDGAGMVVTRLGTLLPLFRGVAFISVTVLTVMFALSTMGVNIGPLIAGAGVLGIAIGFGAQTLVKDIFSGIFFLADDAFRVGEYVEIGNYSGFVDKISIRSMQLRHHLGAVITVPFGELRAITNLNRDYCIYRQDFELPYETDIEFVRKIIEKIGLELMDHPDYGWKFLSPVKSQGVKRVENGALVMGTEFTCLPTEQWELRHFIYQHVRDELYRAGIHLAYRRVQVELPDKFRDAMENGESSVQTKAKPNLFNTVAAAAAASVVVIADEKILTDEPGAVGAMDDL